MSDYHGENRCPDCDGTGGNHYPGCDYDGTNGNYHYARGSGNGMSTFGAIVSVIGGLVAEAMVFTLFGVDVENVSVVVIVILWIVFSFVIGAIISSFER